MAQSNAMDANELENRLERVEHSRSRTPIAPPFDPDDLEQVEEDLRVEREAHEALVSDNGRPCYPIELGLDVFKHPGQYKNLFEHWERESGVGEDTKRWVFFHQLKRWKKFRQFQQKNRRYFVFHSKFPEFQQKVLERRRRHGLDGDVQLLEEQNRQSKLDDWMEYQDYELREYERFEKDFNEAQARLITRRKTLADAGLSAFEGIQELQFASYYSLVHEWCCSVARTEGYKELAGRKLRLAEKRMKIAESANLGEWFERASWVGLFLKEVESAQMRLDESQGLAESAMRDLEPYKRWWYAKRVEWEEKSLEIPEEANRAINLEVESAEFQERHKKLGKLQNEQHKTWCTPFTAKEEVKFAKEVLEAVRSDDLEETIERATLVKLAQEEVRSSQTHFEKWLKKIKLGREVSCELDSISCIKGEMKRHKVLLEWIEQQRREIVDGCADTEKEGGQGRSKRASSRVLRTRPATEASRLNKPPRANSRKRKQSTARSSLGPVDPTKVSKPPRKGRSPHRKMSFQCSVLQEAEETTTDSGTPESRSKQAFKVNNVMPASLRPIHSSRVSKPAGKQPNRLRRDGTKSSLIGRHRLTREDSLGMSINPSTGRRAMQQSGNASLRRSTRISTPPERFRPGST